MTQKGKTHTRSRYDLIAPLYDIMEWPIEKLLFQNWRRELWQQIEGPEVLEIGIGTGKNIPFHPIDINLTGIDLSPKMLRRAKKMVIDIDHQKDRVTLKEMDVQQMDFPDNHFDEAVATFVFCSVPDPILGLKEVRRVTKPGGKLYLLEHMLSKNKRFATVMKKLDASIHYLSGVHIARTTVKNVEIAGWKTNQVQDMTSNGIVRMIQATN